jgi:ATP synthase subunit 10
MGRTRIKVLKACHDWGMRGRRRCRLLSLIMRLTCAILLFTGGARMGMAQSLPATQGESLSGHSVVLAQAVRGHASLVIGSFSKEAGSSCEEWSKQVHGDAAMSSVTVYQMAELEQAPGFIRGMVKSALRKQVPAAWQDDFVVLTQDGKLWRDYFGVTTDKDPWIVLLDADGKVLWHGHGQASTLEPLVRGALK